MNPEAAQERLRDSTGYTKSPPDSTGSGVYTHTLSISFLHKSPFKIVTRKTQVSLKCRWSGLYSVLITEWD
jgi:hypothetical protein